MITEKDLHEAIAECQGQRNPNANTCLKLASYYTILDHITEARCDQKVVPYMAGYSNDAEPDRKYSSPSEFGQIVVNLDPYDVLRSIDELMETLRIMQPRLYKAFMRNLTTLK